MLGSICHITLSFFFLFGVDISVAMISVHCFQQAHIWNELVVSVQPVLPRLAALPTWQKWQSPQQLHAPSISHVMPWICLFCLQSCAAKNVWYQSAEKYQARQSCRCEAPPTLSQWQRAALGIPATKSQEDREEKQHCWNSLTISAQITQAQQESRVSLQGHYSVSSMKDLAFPEITSSSCFVSCWAQLIYMEKPK